ncbi:hypothetical protein TTHERM_01043320 (macronuclear) [Tetrahymena thermophila SB210]|uniref:Dynein heavy chain hydrolytic ATP-binding dynein motor region domain-containing protein n=1 Tax=Tetrahymena thermophila (strain SB210) TaxID=312017 RepID=Q22CH7_TETTS|nr:hypothetical protein TTHERM_01043320 [Tetrahymena thermophila SB210]EAR83015.2 hypothetical protein TTHERM_01043320 [Tetrahymena thermophila SB210]|eukprot:XP_001030678.2 hypothetical protein TTHERM_01043320 [Tetrahymena thermophila SB210]
MDDKTFQQLSPSQSQIWSLPSQAVSMIEDFVSDLNAIRKKVQIGEAQVLKRRVPGKKNLGISLDKSKMLKTLMSFKDSPDTTNQDMIDELQYSNSPDIRPNIKQFTNEIDKQLSKNKNMSSPDIQKALNQSLIKEKKSFNLNSPSNSSSFYKNSSPMGANMSNCSFLNYSNLSLKQTTSNQKKSTFKRNQILQPIKISKKLIQFTEENGELIKIKIENLKNYKSQPLHVFDEQGFEKDEIEEKLLEGLIIDGFSRWKEKNGEISWKACQILSYNHEKKLYKIQWLENEQVKEVTRLNLIVDTESLSESQQREEKAYSRRQQQLFNESLDNLVQSSSKNIDILMRKQILQNIIKKTFDILGEESKNEYIDITIYRIVEQYKFNVIRFQIAIGTVASLNEYYMKYIPTCYYKNVRQKRLELVLDQTLEYISQPSRAKLYQNSKSRFSNYTSDSSSVSSPSPRSSLGFSQQISVISQKSWRSRVISNSSTPKKNSDDGFYFTEDQDAVKEEFNEENEESEIRSRQNSNLSAINLLRVSTINKVKHNPETRFQDLRAYMHKNLLGTSQVQLLQDINGVYPVIISLIDYIQNLQHFRIYCPFKTVLNQQYSDHNQLFNYLEENFLKEINKIENLIYKTEKTIDYLKRDLELIAKQRIQKMLGSREIPPFDQIIKQFLENLHKFCNNVLKSNLNITINESFTDILEMWDSYFLTIPLPHTTPRLFNKLPYLIRHRKQQIILKTSIPSPLSAIELVHEDNIEEKDYNAFKFDCTIIFDIYCEIIQRAIQRENMDSFLFQGNPNLDPTPICKFQLKLSKYRKNPPIRYMFHYFMRCRDKLQSSYELLTNPHEKCIIGDKTRPWRPRYKSEDQYQNQLQYVMYDILRLNNKDTLFYQDYLDKCKNKEVSYKRLGWFDTKHMRINIDPTLEHMEEKLNKILQSPINKFKSLQKINGFLHNEGIECVDEILSNNELFNSHFNEFLTWNYYTIYSILIVFNQFDFYLFEKDYFDELLEIFDNTSQVQFMEQERKKLLWDKDFILRRLPNVFKVGFFEIDTLEIKQIIVKKIDQNIKKAEQAITEKFCFLLNKTNEAFKEMSSILSDDPNTIEKYIDLMTFLSQKDLMKKWQIWQQNLKTINLLYNIMEDNYIKINLKENTSEDLQNEILATYLESQNWLRNLIILFQQANEKLNQRKSHFQSKLDELKQVLLQKFENAKELVAQFKTLNNLKSCEMILRKCKEIEDILKQIVNEGEQINKKELILNYPLSDFKIFSTFLSQFEGSLQFWEFAEKWFRQSEGWLCFPFERLLNAQNGNAQEQLRLEILDSCREGSSLMLKLEKQIEAYKDQQEEQEEDEEYQKMFLDNIQTIQREIDDLNLYLPIIMMLLNKSFKESYWTQLLNEIYGKESKVKPHELTIEILKRDNILRYKKFIYILFNKSQQEQKLYEEIEKVEYLIMECMPKTQTAKNAEYPMHYYGNISHLKVKLDELNFSIIYLISQFDSNEKLKFIQKYVEELKSMFENMIQIQEQLMVYSPFFGILTDFLPDTKYIRTKLRNMNLKIKEEFKKKALQSKNFVQKVIDPKELIKLSQLKKETDHLLDSTMQLKKEVENFIKTVRISHPRFYQLSDTDIFKMMSANFNIVELKQYIIECFSGVKDVFFDIKDENYFVVEYITNYYNEFIYPLEQIKVSRIPKLQGGALCCNSNKGQLPITLIVKQIEECLQNRIKKNIFQNILGVSSCNYDYQNIWKLYQNKQVYFQTLLVSIDVSFYFDLSIILHHQSYDQEQQQEKLENQYKQNEIKQENAQRQSIQKQEVSARSSYRQSKLTRPSVLVPQGFNFKRDSKYMNIQFSKLSIDNKLSLFLKHMQEEQQKFLDFIKLKSRAFSSKSNMQLVNQIILQSISQREIIQYLQKEKISDINCFEYLALPKFTLNCKLLQQQQEEFKSILESEFNIVCESFEKVYENQNLPQISSKSPFFNNLKSNKNSTISMICMNYQIDYGYELTPEIKYFILCQSTQRLYCQIMSCISMFKGCLFVSNEQGMCKISTINSLSIILAKPFLQKNYISDTDPETITRQYAGAAQGGFWVHIQNLDSTDSNAISQIASIYNLIKTAMIEQKQTLELQNYTIQLNPDFALFASYQSKQFFNQTRTDYLKYTQIPQTFLDQFRVVDYASIDLSFVSQCYLTLIGITEIQQFQMQFNYFISALCQNFFVNFGKNVSQSKEKNELYSVLLSKNSFINIYQICIEFQRQRLEVDDFIQPVDALQASILQYLKNLLDDQQVEMLNFLWESFFPTQQKSMSSQFIIDNPNNIDFFREYFQINKLELHEEFIQRANGLLNFVNQKKNIILAGKSGFGKHTLVKVSAFVYSRMNEKDFLVNYIPVESLDSQFLIGSFNQDQQYEEGFLNKLFDTVNYDYENLIEEKKNILLSNEEICCQFSKKKIIDNQTNKLLTIPKKQRIVQKGDWFVFDCGQTIYSEKIKLSEVLLDSIDDNMLYLPSGMTKKIDSENLNFFFFENLSNISPRTISNYSLFILNQEVFSIQEEFQSWLNKKCQIQPKVEAYIPYIQCVFSNLVLKCLEWLDENRQKNDLFVYFTSIKQCFFNFLNIFEILLNEIRKRDISLGLFNYSELSVKERKMTPDPILLRKVSKSQDEQNLFQVITCSAFNKITNERTMFQIESIYTMSILYGLCNCLNDNGKNQFCEYLSIVIQEYCCKDFKRQFNNVGFAFDLMTKIVGAEKEDNIFNYFNYCYSQMDLKWIEWSNIQLLDNIDEVSNDFSQNVLNPRELVRLNPMALEIEEIANYIDNKQDYKMTQFYNFTYFETPSSKIQNYFIDLSLAYNKKMLFCSQRGQGKTTLIKKFINRLYKKNTNSVFDFSTSSPIFNIAKFQSMMEQKLRPKFLQLNPQQHQSLQTNGLKQISQIKNYIFIDDLNFGQTMKENNDILLQIKSLIRFKGWYNYSTKTFKRFKQFSLLSALSIDTNNLVNLLDQSVCQVPQKIIQRSLILYLNSLNEQDVTTIFSKQIDSLFNTEINLTKNDQVMIECWNKFSLLIFKNQDLLKKLRKTYHSNIGLQEGLSIIKYFNNFEFMHNGEVNLGDFLKGFIFLFNSFFCDSFASNTLAITSKIDFSQIQQKNFSFITDSTIDDIEEGKQPTLFELSDLVTDSDDSDSSYQVDNQDQRQANNSQLNQKDQQDINIQIDQIQDSNVAQQVSLQNINFRKKSNLLNNPTNPISLKSETDAIKERSRENSLNNSINSRNNIQSSLNINNNPALESIIFTVEKNNSLKLIEEKENQNVKESKDPYFKLKRNYNKIPDYLISQLLIKILQKYFSQEQIEKCIKERNQIRFVCRKLFESYNSDGSKKKEQFEKADKQIEIQKQKQNEKSQAIQRKSIFAWQQNQGNADPASRTSVMNFVSMQRNSSQFQMRSSFGNSQFYIPDSMLQIDKKTLQQLTEQSLSSESSLEMEGDNFVLINKDNTNKLKNIYIAQLADFYYNQFNVSDNQNQTSNTLITQSETTITSSLLSITSITTDYFFDLMTKINYFLELPEANIIFESQLTQQQTQFFIQYACNLVEYFKTSIQISEIPLKSDDLQKQVQEKLSSIFSNAIKSMLQQEGKKSIVIIELPYQIQANNLAQDENNIQSKLAQYILSYLVIILKSSEFYCLFDRKVIAEMHQIVKKRLVFSIENFTHSQISALILNEMKMNLKIVLVNYQQGSKIFLPFYETYQGLYNGFVRIQFPKNLNLKEKDNSAYLYQSLVEYYNFKKLLKSNQPQKNQRDSLANNEKQSSQILINGQEIKQGTSNEQMEAGELLSAETQQECQRFLELNSFMQKYQITKNQGLQFSSSNQNLQCMIFLLMNGFERILSANEQQICQSGMYKDINDLAQRNEQQINQHSQILGVTISQIQKQYQLINEQKEKDKLNLQENKNALAQKQKEKTQLSSEYSVLYETLECKALKLTIKNCINYLQPIQPPQYKKDIEVLIHKKSQSYLYILALFLDVEFYPAKYLEEEPKVISAHNLLDLKSKVLNSKELPYLLDKIQDFIKKDNENQQKEFLFNVFEKYDHEKTDVVQEVIQQRNLAQNSNSAHKQMYNDYSLTLLYLIVLINSIHEQLHLETQYKPKMQQLREKIQQNQYKLNSLSEEIRQTERQVNQALDFEKVKMKELNQAIEEENSFNEQVNKIKAFLTTVRTRVLKSYLITQNYLDTDQSVKNKQILGIVNYLVFISQYPSSLRIKCLDYLYYNDWIIFQFLSKYLTTTLRGNLFYSKCYSTKVHMSNFLITQLALLETFIYESQYLPSVVVLDNSQVVLNYLDSIKGVTIQKEYYTTDTNKSDEMSSIINAVQQGYILTIVDPNQNLIDSIKPLIQQKFFQCFEKAAQQHFSPKEQKESDLLMSQIKNQQKMKKITLNFNNQELEVHPNFQIIIILTDKNSVLDSQICDQMVCLNCCLEGENEWIQHLKDTFLNNFEYETKLALIQSHQNKVLDRQKSIENSYSSIKQILQRFKISSEETLQEVLSINLQQYMFTLSQIFSRTNPEEVNNITFYKHLKFETKSYNLNKQKQEKMKIPWNAFRSQTKNLSNLSLATVNSSPIIDYENLFKNIFVRKNQIQLQNINNYAYLIGGLEQLSYEYNEISGFLFLIKQVLDKFNPQIGVYYGFSDFNFMNLVELSIQFTQRLSPELKPRSSFSNFFKNISFFMLQSINQVLRDDHKTAMQLQLGLIINQIQNKAPQMKWEMILRDSLYENDEEELYIRSTDLSKWFDFLDLQKSIFKISSLNLYKQEQNYKDLSLNNLKYLNTKKQVQKKQNNYQKQQKQKKQLLQCSQKILQLKQEQISIFSPFLQAANLFKQDDEQNSLHKLSINIGESQRLSQQNELVSNLLLLQNSDQQIDNKQITSIMQDLSNPEIDKQGQTEQSGYKNIVSISKIDDDSNKQIENESNESIDQIIQNEGNKISSSQEIKESTFQEIQEGNSLKEIIEDVDQEAKKTIQEVKKSKVIQETEEQSDQTPVSSRRASQSFSESSSSSSSNLNQSSNSSSSNSSSESNLSEKDEVDDKPIVQRNQSLETSKSKSPQNKDQQQLVRLSISKQNQLGVERKSIFSSSINNHSMAQQKNQVQATKIIKVAKPIQNEEQIQQNMFERTVDFCIFNLGGLINIETKIFYAQDNKLKKSNNSSFHLHEDQKIALFDKVFSSFLKLQLNKSNTHLKSSIYIDQRDFKNITPHSKFKICKGSEEFQERKPLNRVVSVLQKRIHENQQLTQEQKETILPIKMVNCLVNLSNIFQQETKLVATLNKLLSDQKQLAYEFVSRQNSTIKTYNKLFKIPRLNEFNLLNPVDTLLLIKCLKPHELESYAKDFFFQVFLDKFQLAYQKNYEHILKLQIGQHNPFIIISDHKNNKSFYNELANLKLRARKNSQRSNIFPLHRMILCNFQFKSQIQEMQVYLSKGAWVYIENIQYLNSQNILLLTRTIMEAKEKAQKATDTNQFLKIFIEIKSDFDRYEQFSFSNKNYSKEIIYLMNQSYKIYLNQDSTIQESMSSLFADQILRFISVMEDLTYTNQAKINVLGGTFLDPLRTSQLLKTQFDNPSNNSLLQEINKTIHFQTKELILKKQKEVHSSINIHSLILPSKDYTNQQLIKILNQGQLKNKYNLFFMFSCLSQRQNILQYQRKYYQPETINSIDSNQIQDTVEDMIRLVQSFPQNPYIFFSKYLNLLFNKNGSQITTDYGQAIQSLLNSFVNSQYEKQLKYSFDGIEYLMHSTEIEEEQKICKEEQLCIQINSIPSEDVDQIIGISQNNIIQMKHNQSEKLLQFFNKYENQNSRQVCSINKSSKLLFKQLTKLQNLNPQQKKLNSFENMINFEQNLIKDTHNQDEDILNLICQLRKMIQDRVVDEKSILQEILQKRESHILSHSNSLNLRNQQNPIRRGGIQYYEFNNKQSLKKKQENKEQNRQSIIEQFTQDLQNEQQDDGKKTVFSRIKDYLPHTILRKQQKEKNNYTQKDALKMFKNMHNEKKQKKNLEIQVVLKDQNQRQLQDQITQLANTNHIQYLFFQNEVFIMNDIISQILKDFSLIEGYLAKQIDLAPLNQEKALSIINQIKQNKTPYQWIKLGFLTFNLSLKSYFKKLIIKSDHLLQVIKEREYQLFPSIPFYQTFDPYGLLLNVLFQYSRQNKIPMSHLKIKASLIKTPPTLRQDFKEGIIASGIFIQNGDINLDNNYLINENQYQYQSQIPYLQFKIALRSKPEMLQNLDPYIAIEFVDQVHDDIELKYVQQCLHPHQVDYNSLLKQYSVKEEQTGNTKRESSQVKMAQNNEFKKNVVQNSIQFQDGLLHFVKIPVINPLSKELQKEINLKFFFFFKSYMSEEHWIKKSTEIYFAKQC